MRRRTMLRALTAGTATLAGCNFGDGAGETERSPTSSSTRSPSPTPDPFGPSTWPTFGYDAANSGGPADNHGPTDEPSVAWTFEGDDPVGTPVVVDGTAYVTSGSEMVALDAQRGERRWMYSTTERFSTRPVVGERHVVVGSRDDNLYALRRGESGKAWRYYAGADVLAGAAIADDTAYGVNQDGRLVALALDDGTERWTREFDGFGIGGALTPLTVAGDTIYLPVGDALVALSTADGSERWRYEWTDRFTCVPAVADGTAYVTSFDDTVHAVATDDGSQRWYRSHGSFLASVAVVDGAAYYSSRDRTYRVDAADGSVAWSARTDRYGSSSSHPVVADGLVYVHESERGRVRALRADTGESVWSHTLVDGDVGVRRPTVVDGSVFVSTTENTVYALGDPGN